MAKLGSFPALLVLVIGAGACSEPKSRPPPPLVVIATGRPEPEAPPALSPQVAAGGELRGEIDPSFGQRGVGLYRHGPREQRFSQISVLADGSIAAVGYAPFGGETDMMVAHVLANGTLDDHFGDHGFLRVGDKRGFGGAITHDARGRILAAGYFYTHGSNDILIARLDARGELDPSFGGRGLVTRDAGPDDRPHGVFVRGDGHILVAGYYGGSKNAVVGLLPDGAPDTSYGVGGIAVFDAKTTAFATAAAMARDGSVVAGGYLPHEHQGFVALLDPRGRPDPRFGENGVVVPDAPRISSAWAVAFDARGRVLLGGHSDAGPRWCRHARRARRRPVLRAPDRRARQRRRRRFPQRRRGRAGAGGAFRPERRGRSQLR
jgi:uncharacterized delta-60 repeat protein